MEKKLNGWLNECFAAVVTLLYKKKVQKGSSNYYLLFNQRQITASCFIMVFVWLNVGLRLRGRFDLVQLFLE